MSGHHLMNPREVVLPWQSSDELHAILARYKADDDSWPRVLLHLVTAIRAKATASDTTKG